MAAFGSAIEPPGQLVYRASVPFTASGLTVSSFGSAVLLDTRKTAQVPAERPSGDYPAIYALKELPATREILYSVPADTTAYIRYASFTNNSGAAKTVQVWVGGRRIVAALAIAANEQKVDDVLWMLKPGEMLEAQADGVGVDAIITGIEEIR
jgi:hypothetical protein